MPEVLNVAILMSQVIRKRKTNLMQASMRVHMPDTVLARPYRTMCMLLGSSLRAQKKMWRTMSQPQLMLNMRQKMSSFR